MKIRTRLISIKENPASAVEQAIEVLDAGGTVAFPTDTVYGLAASLSSAETIELLFKVKKRPEDRAIAVLIGHADQLAGVTENPGDTAMRLADRFWPGPLTLVVPKHPQIPMVISPRPTIGVRIPNDPTALALLKSYGPLAVTSANLSGRKNCRSAGEVLVQLKGRIDLILDGGETPGGLPSTVVDMTGASLKILREGPISLSQLQAE